MTVATVYDHQAFDRLGDSNDMRGLADEHLDELLALGEIICKHGLERVVGVTLTHRHHDLDPCERFVWELVDDQWHGQPRVMNDEGLVPTNWKVDGTDNNATWRPLEFCPALAEYQPEIDAVRTILENEGFLEEFRKKAVELGVQDIFGIAILQCREAFLREGMTAFEQSDIANRTTTAWPIEETRAEDITGGVTLFHFTRTGELGASQACAHGNSRHCCGAKH